MYLLELSQQHPELSIAEAKALLGLNTFKAIDRYLFIPSLSKSYLKRLAYTKSAYEVLFSCKKKDIESYVKNYPFTFRRSYKISFVGCKDNSLKKSITTFVWNSLSNPKVDLKKPGIHLVFIFINSEVHCCKLLYTQTEDFGSRLPHKRKGHKPISLHPRLARALVNLTGCKRGTIVDPFVGTGGILIEALLSQLSVEGYDLQKEMIELSRRNLSFASSSKITLLQKDFFSLPKKQYLVMDLPYGKNTKNLDLGFFEDVISYLGKIVGKRAVVVFPDSVDTKKLLKRSPLRIKGNYSYYIHKSMTKQIVVLEKKN